MPRLKVAIAMGVDPSTIVRWEAVDELPREQITPLAAMFAVSPAYLTGWADKNEVAA